MELPVMVYEIGIMWINGAVRSGFKLHICNNLYFSSVLLGISCTHSVTGWILKKLINGTSIYEFFWDSPWHQNHKCVIFSFVVLFLSKWFYRCEEYVQVNFRENRIWKFHFWNRKWNFVLRDNKYNLYLWVFSKFGKWLNSLLWNTFL